MGADTKKKAPSHKSPILMRSRGLVCILLRRCQVDRSRGAVAGRNCLRFIRFAASATRSEGSPRERATGRAGPADESVAASVSHRARQQPRGAG